MKAIGRALLAGCVAVVVTLGCSSSVTEPDSETHWLRTCNVDRDCGSGLSCLCGTCTRACTSDTCGDFGAQAKCVTPAASALSGACEAPHPSALCTTACARDVDCARVNTALRCIGGACLIGSAREPGDSAVVPAERCGATPKTLVSAADLFPTDAGLNGVSAGMDVAVNGTDLYYTVDIGGSVVNGTVFATGSVMRVPLAGGRPTRVAVIETQEDALLLTATRVVFAQSHASNDAGTANSGEIVTVPLAGGAPTVIATTTGSAASTLATDGSNVYFADDEGTKSVPLGGGAVRVITAVTGSFALIGPDLIIASASSNGSSGGLFSVPIVGGTPVLLADSQPGVALPISCGADICWTTGVAGSPAGIGTGAIVRLVPGGSPMTLAEDGSLYGAYRFLFDGTDFFLSTVAGESIFGDAFRIGSDGGSPVDLLLGAGIAVDDHCVYSASATDGITSVVKSYTPPTN